MTEKDFKVKYRASHDGLDLLTTLLQDAPVFTPGAHGPKQMPVKYQIMIWLHFFGHEGMTVESQCETLHTCKGLLNLARDRVTNAFTQFGATGSTGQILLKEKQLLEGLNKNSSSQTVWALWMEHC